MKNKLRIFFIGSVVMMMACGGGPPLKPTPPHLLSGTEQIRKGTALYQKGCFKRAFEHFFRAHELYAASDQLDGVAMSLNNIGTVYRATGELESALAFFDKAYAVYGDIEDRAGMRQALSNKAAALIDLRKLEEADKVLAEAAGISVAGSPGPFVSLLSNRGVLLTRKKDYAEAEKNLQEALRAVDAENPAEKATVNYALGRLMVEMKRPKEAIGFYETALNADRTAGFYRGMADDLSGLGRASLDNGERAAAVKYWERSIKIYALVKLPEEVKKTLTDLKAAAAESGADIRVTELFVNRWLEGKVYEKPCED